MSGEIRTKALAKAQLLHPRKETRGYTRWWWYGCAVEKDEILRELDMMKEAGIGGVEVQILYPIVADDSKKGIQNHPYLSPGYFECIRFAAEAIRERDMKFDLTLGSSWPYGGPFVPVELSAPNIIPYTIDVKGPCRFAYDFTTRVYGACVACIMGKMEDCQMLPETIVDITDKVIDKFLFKWEWGKELEPVEIPEGDYKIVVFISNVFDPMTAAEKQVLTVQPEETGTSVEVRFEPFQSLIFVFSPDMDGAVSLERPCEETEIDLSENWKLTVAEKQFEKTYPSLRSWEQEEALRYYSGEGCYETVFELDADLWQAVEDAQAAYLCLEHLGETAAIYLNGEPAGCLFKRPYRLDVRSGLRPGKNVLEIRARNLLINCAIDPDYPQEPFEEPVVAEWPYTTAKLNKVRKERVYNWRECDMIKEPIQAGLWGKITLSLARFHES